MHENEHEQRSLARFGKKNSEIHIFLDQYFEKYFVYHRIVLHHSLGIELIVKKFGEKARGPAVQHIIDDLGSFPGDFREFDIDLENLDNSALGKDLKADLKRLYPDMF